MTSKQVWRFQCEFCSKRGYSASHMAKHERSCTKNPNRVCRMCKMVEHDQRTIAELLSILPDPTRYAEPVSVTDGMNEPDEPLYGQRLEAVMKKAMPKLREATGNCPACIMAALRQKHIPVACAPGFSFTDECKNLWAIINDAKDYEQDVRSSWQ